MTATSYTVLGISMQRQSARRMSRCALGCGKREHG
jgi:hypothetical protein